MLYYQAFADLILHPHHQCRLRRTFAHYLPTCVVLFLVAAESNTNLFLEHVTACNVFMDTSISMLGQCSRSVSHTSHSLCHLTNLHHISLTTAALSSTYADKDVSYGIPPFYQWMTNLTRLELKIGCLDSLSVACLVQLTRLSRLWILIGGNDWIFHILRPFSPSIV